MSAAPEHSFLGEEFLTWLWYRLETAGGDFELDSGPLAVAFDDLLSFAAGEHDETELTLRKGSPTRTAAARAALRAGRRLRRARLILAEGPAEWSVTVDGPTLNLQGIKLPAEDDAAETPRDRSAERIAAFLRLHQLIRHLYAHFLAVRLHPDYLSGEGAAQARWMAAPAP